MTRNVLIATGPVASGGDQGRDFETYRTELAGQTQRLGRQIGMSDTDRVGFSCTLQQDDIGTKIRKDVGKIMASGTPVTFIIAYCEVNIPVARCHDLHQPGDRRPRAHPDTDSRSRPGRVLDAFTELVETLPDAPMYPVEPVTRFLTLNMPLLMEDPRYESIADVFEHLLADTMGDDVVADHALDRATTYFAADRILDGLRMLHRAIGRLANGDSGARIVHAALATAEAYQRLHLYAAAKYYGLLAAGLTRRDDPDLYPQGLFKAAAADYHQGNWASATRLNHQALVAHTLMAERSDELDRHQWVGGALFELVNIKALADKLEPAVTDLVAAAVTDTRISTLFDMFTEAVTSNGPAWWDRSHAA